MEDIKFSSLNELYNRLIPAMETKVKELKINGINFITIDDIWNYLKKYKWSKGSNLAKNYFINFGVSNNPKQFSKKFSIFSIISCFFSARLPPNQSAHRRHKLIDIRTDSFYLSLIAGVIYKFSGFFIFHFLSPDDSFRITSMLFNNMFLTIIHNIINVIDTVYKILNKLFLASEFRACIYRFLMVVRTSLST